MIKFFRRIRQKLLDENRFSKYVLYAIGEIILVVIGILIALQINNQNNIKQNKAIEKTYLSALKEEYITNKDRLDAAINLNDSIINGIDKLIELFEVNVIETTSEKTVVDLFFNTFSTEMNYTPSTGVLKEIISSGNLKLIQNQELRQKIASFESSMEIIYHQENEVNIPRQAIMVHFRDNANYKRYLKERGVNFDFESIFDDRSNKELFKSLNFFNSLFFYRQTSGALNLFCYIPIKEDLENTIALIDEELNKL